MTTIWTLSVTVTELKLCWRCYEYHKIFNQHDKRVTEKTGIVWLISQSCWWKHLMSHLLDNASAQCEVCTWQITSVWRVTFRMSRKNQMVMLATKAVYVMAPIEQMTLMLQGTLMSYWTVCCQSKTMPTSTHSRVMQGTWDITIIGDLNHPKAQRPAQRRWGGCPSEGWPVSAKLYASHIHINL